MHLEIRMPIQSFYPKILSALIFGLFTCIIQCQDHHFHVVTDHYQGKLHSKEFDHQVFLGTEQAKDFSKLTPEQSKEGLKRIIPEIDSNHDNFIDLSELTEWIRSRQDNVITKGTTASFQLFDKNSDNKVSWDEIRLSKYGIKDQSETSGILVAPQELDIRKMKYDKERYYHADIDSDLKLNFNEFKMWLHPESDPGMMEFLHKEIMYKSDRNRDGFVNFNEYLARDHDNAAEIEHDSDWLKYERQKFNKYDENNDGKLDIEEIRIHYIPTLYLNQVNNLARHLIHRADSDHDGKLSTKEMLNNFDVFVGSLPDIRHISDEL